MRALLLCLLFLAAPLARAYAHPLPGPRPQNPAPNPAPTDDREASVKALYDVKRWQDVVDAVPESPDNSPQLDLYRGLALAQLKRLPEARHAFEEGLKRDPRQPRLLEELAGVEYKDQEFSLAKKHLFRALAIQPDDAYASNFLASIYFQENNLEAALKYWNRVGKPQLSNLFLRGATRLDPDLVDRAFGFSLNTEWTLDQYLAAKSRLETLAAFDTMHFSLAEQTDNKFQLTFDSTDRFNWKASTWPWLADFARGLTYQTVYPEFYNLNHSALNWLSMYRWDDQKRRVYSEFNSPLWRNPEWQYRFFVDSRNENWNLAGTVLPLSPGVPSWLNLERFTAGAELRSIPSGRWSWSDEVELTWRHIRDAQAIPAGATEFLTGGAGLSDTARLNRTLLRIPERRFTLDSTATAEFGTFFDRPLGRYARLNGDLHSNWFPRAEGDDWQMQTRLRAGRTFGLVPFDELYMLGFDRDNDLWMRGHNGLRDGQKGGAPLGRNYTLINWDVAKNVFSDSYVAFALGPFVDIGKISDPSGYFGDPAWLWDTGVQAKIRVLGRFEFILGYGRNVRTGQNTFYSGVTGTDTLR